jgi:hypothetical protein
MAEQLAPKLSEGLVPSLRQSQGFVAYCVFAGNDGDVYSVSLFDTRQAANAANDKAREWVQANLRDTVRGPPELMQGEVPNHALAQLRGGTEAKAFVRLNRYGGVKATAAELKRRVDQDVLPLMRGQEGFRGFVNLITETASGMSVVLVTSPAAERSPSA